VVGLGDFFVLVLGFLVVLVVCRVFNFDGFFWGVFVVVVVSGFWFSGCDWFFF